MRAATTSVEKTITFSQELYSLIFHKARQFGLSFEEYMRHLAVTDAQKGVEEIPMVDEETNKMIGKSLEDYAEGRYVVIDPSDEKEFDKVLGIT